MDLLSLAAVPAIAYLVMALFVAFDAIIPAVPGEVVVVSAGALASTGRLDVGWAVTAAATGAVAGDLAMFSLGRRTLPGALQRSRLGRRLSAKAHRANTRMGSSSAVAIVVARFVPFGRTTVVAAAGLVGLPRRRFTILALIGCALWAMWLVGLGFVSGNVADVPLWQQVGIGAAIGIAAGVWAGAVHTIVQTRRRMTARAAMTATTTPATLPSQRTALDRSHGEPREIQTAGRR